METFIIDNTYTLPTPGIDVQYTEQDLQQHGKRDDSGILHKKTVRWGVRRIDLRWPLLTSAEMTLVRQAVKGREYFSFQYFSDSAGVSGNIPEAYSGDYTYKLHTAHDRSSPMWTDVHLAIIER
ncbi:MAG: hypothetical protein IKF39_02425 [Oscillospiraceae bacterium]|nr:hypothetical protein [Oscillospiraceae bacterium]